MLVKSGGGGGVCVFEKLLLEIKTSTGLNTYSL